MLLKSRKGVLKNGESRGAKKKKRGEKRRKGHDEGMKTKEQKYDRTSVHPSCCNKYGKSK